MARFLAALVLLLAGCGKTASLAEVPGLGSSLSCPDPGMEGPLHTVHFDLDVAVSGGVGRLQVTVFGPSDDGVAISAAGAPYPLVVLSPAATIPKEQYFDYAYRLANHGFLAVTQEPRPGAEGDHRQYQQDISSLLDWLGNPMGVDSDRVAGKADLDRVGLFGHGLGGKIAFLVAESDRRVGAVLGVDPVDSPDNAGSLSALPGLSLLGPMVRTGLLGEDLTAKLVQSCTPAGHNYLAFYQDLPPPTFAITLLAAGHMDFVDDLSSCFPCTACGGGALDQQAIHRLAVKFTAAFFQTYMQGCTGSESYLTGAEFMQDASSTPLQLRRK